MKKEVECVSEKDTAEDAACMMKDENIGFLPVCADDNKAIGTVTDRDLAIRVLAEGKGPETLVADVMTREVVCCRPEDHVRQAAELLAKHKKSRIMCCDADGKLVGVISLSDIAQHEGEADVSGTLREVTEREATAP